VFADPPPELKSTHRVGRPATALRPRLASVSRQGDLVAYLSGKQVHLWHKHGAREQVLELGEVGAVHDLEVSGNGKYLAVQSFEDVHVWELSQKASARVLSATGRCFAFGGVGQKLAVAGRDGQARIYDLKAPAFQAPPVPLPAEGGVQKIALSGGGGRFLGCAVSLPGRSRIHIRDVLIRQQRSSPAASQAPVVALAFDPSRPQLAAASTNGLVHLVDCRTGAELGRPLATGLPALAQVCYASNGRTFLVANATDTVQWWSVGRLAKLKEWRFAGPIAALNAHGRHVALVTGNGTLLQLALPDVPETRGP
jgi:WD40 repeat protein